MPQITLWQLFIAFAKIGSMTFGGGYAMLPVIERELVDKRRWATYEQLLEYYSLAHLTPGVIAVNVATLTGWQHRRAAGALAATAGLVLPSLVIITLIAAGLETFAAHPVAARIFAALQVCVAALVINAVIPFFKRGVTSALGAVLFAAAFAGFWFFSFSPFYSILFCALIYLLLGGKK